MTLCKCVFAIWAHKRIYRLICVGDWNNTKILSNKQYLLMIIPSWCIIEYFYAIIRSPLSLNDRQAGTLALQPLIWRLCPYYSNDLHFFCDFLLNIIMIHCSLSSLNIERLDLLLSGSAVGGKPTTTPTVVLVRGSLDCIGLAYN